MWLVFSLSPFPFFLLLFPQVVANNWGESVPTTCRNRLRKLRAPNSLRTSKFHLWSPECCRFFAFRFLFFSPQPQEQITEAESTQLSEDLLSKIGLSEKARKLDLEINPYPSPRETRVAICLVGAARDFEISGPSIMTRLLTAYPGTHLFVHSPLDEASFKLHALAWAPANVTIAGVRVFPNWWVDEAQFPDGVIVDPTSPQGTQVRASLAHSSSRLV